MAEKKNKQTLLVTESGKLAEGIYSLTVQYPETSSPKDVKPGQFVGVYPKDSSALLPRPISICEWNKEQRTLRIVYRVVGKGTGEFSHSEPGDQIDILGILGNGYDVPSLTGKKVLLLGGGIGAPPMLGLAEALYEANLAAGEEKPEELVTAAMGYRTDDLFLTEEFEKVSSLLISTDDGTAGIHGNVMDAVRALLQGKPDTRFDAICACGPMPMLRGVKAFAEEQKIPAWISLEERMACGVGACLGCVAKTVKKDEHSQVHNARVCTEGPVFAAEDVEI